MNKSILSGNVGGDPDIRTVGQASAKLARFTIATNAGYMKDGQWIDGTDWHTIQCWNKLAERVEKTVKKGSKVLIEGSLKHDSYEKDGVKKYYSYVLARSIEIFNPEKSESTGFRDIPKKEPVEAFNGEMPKDDDDLPF